MSTVVLNFRNYISKLNFKLLSYDKLKYEHDWESIEHSHPYSEILFVTGGHGAFINNGNQRPLSKGDIVITNPYVSHTEISLPPPSQPLEYIVISLDEIYFTPEDAEEIFSDRSYIYNISAHWNEIENFLERIQQEINTEALLWENAVLSIINELLILILRFTNLNNLHTEGTMPTTHSNRIVWLVRQYMEQYYAEPITLNMLAEKFYINKFYLERCFKQIVGCTPLAYLKNVRIDRAKTLLLSTDFTISEISLQVGFASASHFAKTFQKVTGMTPSAFLRAPKCFTT